MIMIYNYYGTVTSEQMSRADSSMHQAPRMHSTTTTSLLSYQRGGYSGGEQSDEDRS